MNNTTHYSTESVGEQRLFLLAKLTSVERLRGAQRENNECLAIVLQRVFHVRLDILVKK